MSTTKLTIIGVSILILIGIGAAFLAPTFIKSAETVEPLNLSPTNNSVVIIQTVKDTLKDTIK